ncbi:MAG: hypothetical protein ACFFCQ_18335 [Promethearchaeota archaeon]
MIRFIVIIKDGTTFFFRRYEPPREDENLIESEALLVSLLRGINTFLEQTTETNYSELVFEDKTRVYRLTTRQHGQDFVTYVIVRQIGYDSFQAIQKINQLISDYAYLGQIYSRVAEPSKLKLEPIVLSELDAIVQTINGSVPDPSEWRII